MVQLVKPLLPEREREPENQTQGNLLSQLTSMATSASASIPHLIPIVFAVGGGVIALRAVYRIYRKIPPTGQYLSAYIVNLTCVLHRLFLQTLTMAPPRKLSDKLISKVVTKHKQEDCDIIHRRIQGIKLKFEKKIEGLIWETIDNGVNPPASS